jgi:hypothetical protein
MPNTKKRAILVRTTGVVTMILIAAAMIIVTSRQTVATPDISKKTGKPCTACHSPAPPTLNDYGRRYKGSQK